MRVIIFGATGRTGRLVVEQALEAGHFVTAYVRNPAKLGIEHARLTVVEGEIHDRDAMGRAIAGSDAVLSVLRPTGNEPAYEVSQGTQNIVAAMKEHGVRRLIVTTAFVVVPHPGDKPRLPDRVGGFLFRRIYRHDAEDMRRAAESVKKSELDWTIVRVLRLVDGPRTGRINLGLAGRGLLNRANLAEFVLQQVSDETHIHQAPVISN
ncbi:MAG: NAD(P)-dependent oxidoreductase [Anaerolineae bacterium]